MLGILENISCRIDPAHQQPGPSRTKSRARGTASRSQHVTKMCGGEGDTGEAGGVCHGHDQAIAKTRLVEVAGERRVIGGRCLEQHVGDGQDGSFSAGHRLIVAPSSGVRLGQDNVVAMTTVTWLERPILMGVPVPHQYGAAEDGRHIAMVRQGADRRSWRVCVYPGGDSGGVREAVAGSERQAKRWVERWAAKRTISYPVPEREKLPHEGEIKPRKPKGTEDRS